MGVHNSGSGPLSVLVVDDHETALLMLSVVIEIDDRLELAGQARDGLSAVQRAGQTCPDAIVCDVQMPGLGGMEAVPLLRKTCPDSVIVMYSADPDAARVACDLGADAVVDKATHPDKLVETLVALCAARR